MRIIYIGIGVLSFFFCCCGAVSEKGSAEADKTERNISHDFDCIVEVVDRNEAATHPIGTQSIVVGIDNSNRDKIGFLKSEMGESIFVTDILLHDHYVYIVDQFHMNVKRIEFNENSYTISTSTSVNEKQKAIKRIALFNGNIVLFSELGNVYFFDKQLNLDKQIHIDSFKGGMEIFCTTGEEIFFYRSIEDISQSKDRTMNIALTKINKGYDLSRDTVRYTYNDYTTKTTTKNGKRYIKEVSPDKKSYLITPFGKYFLPSNIEPLNRYISAVNMDFDENRIVSYRLDENEKSLEILIFYY